MKNSKKFLIASGIGVAAGAALFVFLKKKNLLKNNNDLLSSDYEDEMYLDFSGSAGISYEDAERKACEVAREKLGSDVAVVSASDKKTLTVNIEGIHRHCFLFGAAGENLAIDSQTLLLYVDASTGEVFDSDKVDQV